MTDNPDRITAGRWGIAFGEVSEGRLTGFSPYSGDRWPSPNLSRWAKLPYSEKRIRTPMVREGFLKRGSASRAERGSGGFVAVGWDDALALAVREIERVYAEYGPSAVWGRSYGWMSTGRVHSAVTLVRRLLSCLGGCVNTENSYSTAAIGKILPYVVGASDPRSTCWEVVLEKSERVVFWGADPMTTLDVDWNSPLHQGRAYLAALKSKGIRTVSINPVETETGRFLDSEWIAPRPGTDAALMLGVMHALLDSGRADLAFLKRCTSGSEVLIDCVLGRTDGEPKTPEWAQAQCGVPAAAIRGLAQDWSAHRTMLMLGWGPQRAQFGEQFHWMGFALAAMLGQIGTPGGGIGTNYHYSSAGSPVGRGPALATIPTHVAGSRISQRPWKGSRTVPVARVADCLLHPGESIAFNGRTVEYPDIRLVFWAGGNPFAHQPDVNKLSRAFKRPEAVIVVDSMWTATARHADIVLPAATAFERSDITSIGTYTNDGIAAMKQLIPVQHDARPDYSIFSDLADRLGVGELFTEGLDEMGWIRRLYEGSRAQAAASGLMLPSFEDFWRQGIVRYPVDEASRRFVAFEDFVQDPEAYPLKTETGKIVLYSDRIAGYGYADCPPHPAYIPPEEGVNAATPELPLALVSSKTSTRLHSQMDPIAEDESAEAGALVRNEAPHKIAGREPVWMHPDDAAARGIETGDVVRVFNHRGATLCGAFVTHRVMRGVVVIRNGAWFAPESAEDAASEAGLDTQGCANVLTPDVPASQLSSGNISSTANVQVEKWFGPRGS